MRVELPSAERVNTSAANASDDGLAIASETFLAPAPEIIDIFDDMAAVFCICNERKLTTISADTVGPDQTIQGSISLRLDDSRQ